MNIATKGAAILSMLAAMGAASVDAVAQHQLTENVVPDPDAAQFVYQDVQNFVRAMEDLASGADTVAILQAEYFAKATPGLRVFIQKYNLTSERLIEAIRTYPQKCATLPKSLDALRTSESSYRAAYSQLEEEIRTAVFPPTLSVPDGVATYCAERVAGGSVHKNRARDFLLAHEPELWHRFRSEMLAHETGMVVERPQ